MAGNGSFNGWANVGTWRIALVLANDAAAYDWATGKKPEEIRHAVRAGRVPLEPRTSAICAAELRLALREGGIDWAEIAGAPLAAGAVAIQQALIVHFGLSYRAAARLAKVSPRTVWQHVAARPGSKVRAWEARVEAERAAAISAAGGLIEKRG